MGINYDPKNVGKAWPEADYHATLTNVEDAVSKSSGDDMEVWTITVYNDAGITQTIKDYVTAGAAFKIKQLAKALDRKADFESGKFHAEDYIGSSFLASLKIEEDDEYGDKNKIKTYKSKPASTANSLKAHTSNRPVQNTLTAAGTGIPDADIPFAPNVF